MQIPYIPVHNHLSFSLKSFAKQCEYISPTEARKALHEAILQQNVGLRTLSTLLQNTTNLST
ncbi:hypothetical protein BIFADO_01897 [Bifidobacterium adolescentis L2-32]|uniref:Uncharacterized protein n=1 Tax=Bifidobacterium adolescentis L2-32 TaxID=411481 RepID=A7A7Q7_BIFAD|nr:hypothetical protein BIFADO_01897 [Bifidobacterium adolescentis L2-32]